MEIKEGSYVLGLELGVACLGWAALTLDSEGRPAAVLALGARKFPVGTIGDIASGREVSRNERRQAAKSQRVARGRRMERLASVWRLLEGAGLLPGPFKARDAICKRLDGDRARAPYAIRARALDEAVAPHELGRALYHLAQRRGFQSSRKDRAKPGEELGVVKQGIEDLAARIAAGKKRTLGEYLADLREPLRRRWLGRAMVRAEAEAVLAAQRAHHAALTPSWERALLRAMFDQRPLKSQAHRIGRCELEPSRRRMLLAMPDAQEFRVLQRVNDLRLVEDVGAVPVELTAAQRAQILAVVENGDATFAALRKALGLPRTVRFNAERIDDKTLVGMRTEARLRKALPRWLAMPENDRRATAAALVTIDEEVGLRRWLTRRGFSAVEVETLLAVDLEPGVLHHSHKAVARLLPSLRAGCAYARACKDLYPNARQRPMTTRLPLVSDVYPHLRSPLVNRALYEVRAVVNALVARYGRPARVHVELVRDLRIGRRSRERIQMAQRARQRQRAAAAARILADLGVQEPAPWMIDKWLLAEECGWVCPYTGKAISIRTLLGGEPSFEVAHLIPLHQSLDDSFANKILCHTSRIAEAKALRRTDDLFVERVAKFQGVYAEGKRARARASLEEVSERYGEAGLAAHFVDACYASKLAADYLSRLYPPLAGKVLCVRGGLTRHVREACGLSRVDWPRTNFRDRAVGAACVALADAEMVRRLSGAALSALPGRRRFAPEVALPWPAFSEDVRRGADAVCVSSRVDRRASGALHEQTVYAAPARDGEGKIYHTTRKALWQLTPSDLAHIERQAVREAVASRVAALGGGDPRKLFARAENLPSFGGAVTRRVRVRRYEQAFSIGSGSHRRWVCTEENHHIALFLTPAGRADRVLVSQFEAQRRRAAREPIVQRPEGRIAVKGLATLAVGETLLLDKKLMTVRSVSKDPRVSLTAAEDGRPLGEILASRELVRLSVEQLRQRGACKVVVGPLGAVQRAGD